MSASRSTPAADRSAEPYPVRLPRRALLTAAGLTLLSGCAPAAYGGPRQSAKSPGSPADSPSRPAREPRKVARTAESTVDQAPGQKAVVLSLDDGPDPDWTPQVLEILAEHEITATFFMLGRNATAYPDAVRAVADAGHQLATHSWSHPDLRKLSASGVRTEIERGLDAVARAAGGPQPALFRAPYGNWSPAVFQTCAELDQRPIGWSVDPGDWERPGADTVASRVLDQIHPGAVVLNHDGGGNRSQTVAALRGYLPRLLDEGYQFVAL